MKVFIAYKQRDEYEALLVRDALIGCGAEAFAEAVSDEVSAYDKKLNRFIGERLDNCTDVIAVVSGETKHHWWAQLLIETALMRDMPAAVFLSGWTELPECLQCAPRLRLISEVDSYAAVRMS